MFPALPSDLIVDIKGIDMLALDGGPLSCNSLCTHRIYLTNDTQSSLCSRQGDIDLVLVRHKSKFLCQPPATGLVVDLGQWQRPNQRYDHKITFTACVEILCIKTVNGLNHHNILVNLRMTLCIS